MAPLTKRQKELLDFLTSYSKARGYMPSFEEIAEAFGYKSLATIHEHLVNLEKKGAIRRNYNEARGIEIVEQDGDHVQRQLSAAWQEIEARKTWLFRELGTDDLEAASMELKRLRVASGLYRNTNLPIPAGVTL